MKILRERNLRKIFRKAIRLWLPPTLWAIVIFLFSSRPTTPVTDIHLGDFIVKKTAHIVEYAVLTALLYRAMKESGIKEGKAGIYSIILAVFYGATDEFHQSFTPGRDPRLRDVFFDTIGSVLAIYGIWKWLPKAPKRLKKLAKNWRFL